MKRVMKWMLPMLVLLLLLTLATAASAQTILGVSVDAGDGDYDYDLDIDELTVIATGTCGDNLTWHLAEDGDLARTTQRQCAVVFK